MTETVSGIYRIICIENGRSYYGSSVNIYKRWNTHKSLFRKGIHKNSIMQNAWNKYGEDSFQYELLEVVSIDKLLEVEQVYLSEYVGKCDCFNIATDASAPMLGMKMSDKTRRKMSEAHKGKKNHFYGKHHTAEARKKIKEARASQVNISQKKLSQKQILEIRMSKMPQRILAVQHGVSQRTIWNVLHDF